MLVPILALVGIGFLVSRLRKRGGIGVGGGGDAQLRIEGNMPLALRNEVLRAMQFESNPRTLVEFAESLSKSYPWAAYEIRTKAWVLGGRQGPVPAAPVTG